MKNRKSKLVLGGTAALLVAGSVVGFSTPALANSTQCPAGQMCLWIDTNYDDTGSLTGFYHSNATSDSQLPAGINAKASSSWNREAVRVAIWSGNGFAGSGKNLAANQMNIDLNSIGASDWIRSWRQNP